MAQIGLLLFISLLLCVKGCLRCLLRHRKQVRSHSEYAMDVFTQDRVPEQMAGIGKEEQTRAHGRRNNPRCPASTHSMRPSFALNMVNDANDPREDYTDAAPLVSMNEEDEGAYESRDITGRVIDDGERRKDDDSGNEEEEDTLKQWMIDAIYWYKDTLSPVMPPNCRFLPTCSTYGIQSIKEFGATRGGILTAWRIFRCNPFGGCGFDPPQWPPPSFRAGSNTKNWF